MYSNILVPIALDHDDAAAAAIEIAQALRAQGGRLTLLHVLDEVPSFVSTHLPEGVLEGNVKAAESELARIAGPVGAEAKVVWGHSARTILDFAQDHQNDCIVIASHKPGLQDYFLGSTAAHVVRHAQCSVHVLR